MNLMIFALAFALLPAVWYSPAPQQSSQQNSESRQNAPLTPRDQARITREVHHQLVLLPYYGVFDNLEYKVASDGTVTLLGQVRKPVLKSDAENAVKNIEGVPQVKNEIKVLPLSNMDDSIRIRVYRAIYSAPALTKYEYMAVPPIHIIVDNGHITLEGVVDSKMDKQIAETKAKGVPGVFSVQDNLRIVGGTGGNGHKS